MRLAGVSDRGETHHFMRAEFLMPGGAADVGGFIHARNGFSYLFLGFCVNQRSCGAFVCVRLCLPMPVFFCFSRAFCVLVYARSND